MLVGARAAACGVFMVEGEMEGEMSIGMRKYDARVLVSGRT